MELLDGFISVKKTGAPWVPVPRAQPGDSTQGCPHVELCPGSLPSPPFTQSLLQHRLHLLPARICLLGTVWIGPYNHKGHLDATGLGKQPALELQEAPEGWDGMCPVTVTAPATLDLRWNRTDAPKHEQVSLS